jgi:ribosome maturation factor RimP
MINKDIIKTAVEEWLEQGDYYLVDVEMTGDDRIVIEIDHADGVWIEDCADLSRFLQEKLGDELGDYELEVGSAGIGQPFKVIQQYRNHIGKEVEVLQNNGQKMQGILKEVADDSFVVTVKEKQTVEGKKRPVLVEVDKSFAIADVKYCKYLLNFK